VIMRIQEPFELGTKGCVVNADAVQIDDALAGREGLGLVEELR